MQGQWGRGAHTQPGARRGDVEQVMDNPGLPALRVAGIFVPCSCCNRAPQTGQLKQWRCILSQRRGCKSTIKGLAGLAETLDREEGIPALGGGHPSRSLCFPGRLPVHICPHLPDILGPPYAYQAPPTPYHPLLSRLHLQRPYFQMR